MRKFISMLLIIAFALSFAACGKVEEEPVSPQVPMDILGDGDFVPELPAEGTGNAETTASAEIKVELTEEQKIKLAEDDELAMGRIVKCFWDAYTNLNFDRDLDEQFLEYNFSCYSDSAVEEEQRIADTLAHWHYDSNSVLSEGESYLPDGIMEGVTFTFYPSQKGDTTVFKLEDVRVNEIVAGAYADPMGYTSVKLADINEELFAFVRQVFGDEIVIKSPMYCNSCFTVFINNSSEEVYGQWSGRNLPSVAEHRVKDIQTRLESNANDETFLLGLDALYTDSYLSAIKQDLAKEETFNELMQFVCTNNVSCYINSDDESALESERVYLSDSTEEYVFDVGDANWDNVKGIAAGNMTGLTLTCPVSEHDGELVLKTKDIIINQFVRNESLVATGRKTNTPKYLCGITPDYEQRGYLYDEESYGGYFYNRLRAYIGDYHRIRSECYRNSEYTVFVRMTDDPEGLIEVYGQWNGINISN